MAKLEDLLKAQGFTDAEIQANAALLNDPKVRGALETSYQKLEADLTSFRTENDNWKEWHETHGKPTLALYEKDRADAVAEAAALKARLKLAEDGGFAPVSERKVEDPKPLAASESFDPKKHNLVTHDEISRLAAMEGEAIAMANDLNEEYRHLTGGKSLFEYQTTLPDGRVLRGTSALLQESRAAKKPLNQFVSEKFDFAGKRQAIADKQRADERAAIASEERAKLVKEFGDPNLRPLVPSTNPFVPRVQGDDKKQPWEGGQTSAQLRASRLERAMQTQMGGKAY